MDMTPGHKQWKKFTLTRDALSAAWWPCPPFTWNNSISLGLNLFNFDLDNTPWVKCDKCHTPFHLQCGTWESVYVVRSNVFFVLFFVVDSFRSPCHLFFSYSLRFPMLLVFQIPPLPHVTCVSDTLPPFAMSLVFYLCIPII